MVSAECSLRDHEATLFDYDGNQGIVRYPRVCPDCGAGYYRLSGERGLFGAAGSDPGIR